MRPKVDYYILVPKDKFFMTKAEWKRFHKNLNKAVATVSISVKELGNAFGRVAKILKDDKFYKAICKANKYIKEQEKIK
jgi:hypothetical protein